MEKRKIYIAGPYTKSDPVLNVRASCYAADRIIEAGAIPFVPHLSHLWHLVSPKPHNEWLAYDGEWIRACDALVRLPGESPGADWEVAQAKSAGIPVFFGLENLLEWLLSTAHETPKRKKESA